MFLIFQIEVHHGLFFHIVMFVNKVVVHLTLVFHFKLLLVLCSRITQEIKQYLAINLKIGEFIFKVSIEYSIYDHIGKVRQFIRNR